MKTLLAVVLTLASLALVSWSAKADGTEASAALTGMRWLDNEQVRIGINLSKGGAITWLGKSGGVNLVNSFDLARQIQMSYYSGPIPFAPHGKTPTPTWAGLGWNPIQSGDCHGQPSRTLRFRSNGREITLQCLPMQWPLDDEPGECTFESTLRLDGAAVYVRSRIICRRSDSPRIQAAIRNCRQSTPAAPGTG